MNAALAGLDSLTGSFDDEGVGGGGSAPTTPKRHNVEPALAPPMSAPAAFRPPQHVSRPAEDPSDILEYRDTDYSPHADVRLPNRFTVDIAISVSFSSSNI